MSSCVTHCPNIVVNGDADRVIALDVTSGRSSIRAMGTIEQDDVRLAIIDLLDGGEDAFALRNAKYGFQETGMEWLDVLRRIGTGEDERTESGSFRGWSEVAPHREKTRPPLAE